MDVNIYDIRRMKSVGQYFKFKKNTGTRVNRITQKNVKRKKKNIINSRIKEIFNVL